VAIIDILHRIPYRDERDLARISQLLGDTAKLARCVVLATVHLNRGRIVGAARPQPTLADIKGASAFEQDADVVGMVWRQDDEVSGRPQNHGLIYTLKQRMDVPGGVPVIFDGSRATFVKEM
jgi:replicative DNA helicase